MQYLVYAVLHLFEAKKESPHINDSVNKVLHRTTPQPRDVSWPEMSWLKRMCSAIPCQPLSLVSTDVLAAYITFYAAPKNHILEMLKYIYSTRGGTV